MSNLNHSRTLAARLFAACLAIVATLFGTAAINPTVSPDVFYVTGATRKISQLIGDTDFETLRPTQTRTESRVGVTGTDLGVSFVHKGVTYLVFGDTLGSDSRDSMATSLDT